MKQHSHKATLLFLIGLVLIFGTRITAQAQFRVAPVKKIGDSITCHVGDDKYKLTPNKRLIFELNYAPNSVETQEIFEKLSEYTELRSTIYTVPVEDDINVQICPGDVNYIVYNAAWLKAIYDETNNLWAVYAIIAHEIGHYVLAHDRKALGSNPKIELEADEYAGEILAKMRACLSDAQAAYRSRIMGSNQASHTHPPINQRLAAVKRGWEKFGTACLTPQVTLPQALPQVNVSRVSLTIVISGQLHNIYIVPASGAASTGSFAIGGQGSTQTFYLEYGTAAEVIASGQNNKIYVPPALSNRVKLIQSGQNNEIIIR
jgi:hypothetical protein